MKPMRAAVIGVGYVGGYHAEKYAALPEAKLVAVIDIDAERGRRLAGRLGCQFLADYRDLDGEVDAVSIAVPTSLHYEVARYFMDRGVHVLVEKPVTTTVKQADALVALAAKRKVCLQVGHLERFNAVMQAMAERVTTPMFIESNRVAPFTLRGADVSVILDLMIHDIDIILHLVGEPITQIDAHGLKVISGDIDIANAHLQFANGCVANVTASRVGLRKERKMRLFQPNAYIVLDFQAGYLEIRRKGEAEQYPGTPTILSEKIDVENGDALWHEIAAFTSSVRNGLPPVISGSDGRQALAIAIEITRQLRNSAMPGSRFEPGFAQNTQLIRGVDGRSRHHSNG